jgi:protein-S-isoprenylcysteine O-methyltransferase Ste14
MSTTSLFIEICWIAWILYWVLMAFQSPPRSSCARKEGHELIESGPYALVRHPIYTGLLAMGLGTAINYGQALGFALFLGLCGGLWWKLRQEERIMSSHFPDSYADYKSRVHAIIPFLL